MSDNPTKRIRVLVHGPSIITSDYPFTVEPVLGVVEMEDRVVSIDARPLKPVLKRGPQHKRRRLTCDYCHRGFLGRARQKFCSEQHKGLFYSHGPLPEAAESL